MHSKIQKQIEVLNTKIRFFGRTKIEDQLEALDQIGELGTPYDVQYICRFAFSKYSVIAKKTAAIIRKLLTTKEVKFAWHRLYNSCSFSFDYYHLDNGYMFGKKEFKKIAKFAPEEAAHLYGIASLNHSGYVREKALNYLQNLHTSEILPYILLRLNDWVSQVRVKAEESLVKVLPSISVTDLIKYYSLIEWLEKTERINLKDVQNKISVQIRDPNNREELFKAMEKVSFRERLFCWKALTEEVVNNSNLIDKAIADPAPEIRQWAARNLPNSDNFNDSRLTLLTDSAIRVRYTALKGMSQNDFGKYRKLFEIAIFDDSKPIREYARFMLHSNGDDNHVDKYRRKMAELKNKANPGLVAGLAETGAEEDIKLIKGFVDHKNSKIRASVLYALNRLKAEGVDNLYMLGLQDNNAHVRNTCISILQSGYNYLRPKLEDLLEKADTKTQKAVLKVLIHYGALDSLKNILFALTAYEELQSEAWQYLANWHCQYAAKPWFSFSDDTYRQTLQLLDDLRKTNIELPDHASIAWNDLPNIMKTINKK